MVLECKFDRVVLIRNKKIERRSYERRKPKELRDAMIRAGGIGWRFRAVGQMQVWGIWFPRTNGVGQRLFNLVEWMMATSDELCFAALLHHHRQILDLGVCCRSPGAEKRARHTKGREGGGTCLVHLIPFLSTRQGKVRHRRTTSSSLVTDH